MLRHYENVAVMWAMPVLECKLQEMLSIFAVAAANEIATHAVVDAQRRYRRVFHIDAVKVVAFKKIAAFELLHIRFVELFRIM